MSIPTCVLWFLCGIVSSIPSDEKSEGAYNFNRYEKYDVIKQYLDTLAKKYSTFVTVEYPMHSSERRGIPLVKISRAPEMKNDIIFLEAGMHGREWSSPAVAMNIIRELVENKRNEYLIKDFDWYIAPLVNPDGYEYSHRYDPLWRKTTAIYKNCKGVDGNRNFAFHWKPSQGCREDHPGSRPFSEPETLFIKNQILSNQKRVKAYISLHCCGKRIFRPWGFTEELPEDIDDILDLAVKVQKAMSSVRESVFEIGSPRESYPVFGSAYDWVKGVGGVNISFTIELADGQRHPSEIAPSTKEVFEGLKVIHKDLTFKYVDN